MSKIRAKSVEMEGHVHEVTLAIDCTFVQYLTFSSYLSKTVRHCFVIQVQTVVSDRLFLAVKHELSKFGHHVTILRHNGMKRERRFCGVLMTS